MYMTSIYTYMIAGLCVTLHRFLNRSVSPFSTKVGYLLCRLIVANVHLELVISFSFL